MTEQPRRLTERQQQVYDFIQRKIRDRGYGPTIREIGEQFEIRSPNGVMCHLQALEKKGLIERQPNMSRAISIVRKERPPVARSPQKGGLPLVGSVAAGLPVETFEQHERFSFHDRFEQRADFVLKVRGQSMIEDNIDEGDFVVVRKQELAKDGDIVVALVDGAETTLKRFFREPHRIRLEPANRKMKPIYSSDVQVLGVVIGVVRDLQ